MSAPGARDRKYVHVARHDAGHLETRAHRHGRKAGHVLDAAKPLLFDRGHELPGVEHRRCHVAVIRVEAEDQHDLRSSAANSRRENCAASKCSTTRRWPASPMAAARASLSYSERNAVSSAAGLAAGTMIPVVPSTTTSAAAPG